VAVKGAPERVWARAQPVARADVEASMTDATRIMMEAGERVLGFAYTELSAEQYPRGMRAGGVGNLYLLADQAQAIFIRS